MTICYFSLLHTLPELYFFTRILKALNNVRSSSTEIVKSEFKFVNGNTTVANAGRAGGGHLDTFHSAVERGRIPAYCGNWTAGTVALPFTDYSPFYGLGLERTIKTRIGVESQCSNLQQNFYQIFFLIIIC